MGTRTCPQCGRPWSQRDARFCGVCGAALPAGRSRSAQGHRRRVAAARALAAIGVVALFTTAASLELSRPPQDIGIDVSDDATTSTNPLSDDEVALLREQSDPGRLRCEPRGCATWRYERNGAPMASGAVELGDGAVLLLIGDNRPAAARSDDDPDDPDRRGHRLVALDAATGAERWSRSVAGYRSISGAYRWVRLLDGPDGGALIVSGTTVTAIGPDGEPRWTAAAATSGGPVRDVWEAVTTDDVVLLSGTVLNRASTNHHLTAVDHATGEMLWSTNVGRIAVMDADQLVVVDPDGTVRGLDDATGQTRWERPGAATDTHPAGPWLAVHDAGDVHLVDPDTGQVVTRLDGWLASDLVAVEDGWLGTLRVPPVDGDSMWDEEGGQMRVVRLGADGRPVWSSPLGRIRPWWDCCPIRVDAEAGIATVIDPVRHLDHDLATGRLLDARVTSDGTEETRNEGLSGDDVSHPRPHVEVVASEGPYQLAIRTPDGRVTIRSDRPLVLESLDPLIVADSQELLGVRIPAEGDD